MSVKIRLTRIGRTHDAIYRVVVADSHFARDGRFIEQIGQYNPGKGFEAFNINEERVLYWLKQGANPSDTVKALLNSKGLIAKFENEKKSAKEGK